MLWEIRRPLLEEAKNSPSLLSDLAGLENYIAESYDSRSFVELLQNADDAGASRFVITKSHDNLLIANNGRHFTQSDIESLCRSAASSKSRGTSIGYRGIGFKSVVGLAHTIHLISGNLAVTFSRERTAKEIPQATRVPLVRIPHQFEEIDHVRFKAAIDCLVAEGLSTVFVFDHLLAGAIEKEFSSFDPTSLLFLRNVRHVGLRTETEAIINVSRSQSDAATRFIRLTSDGNSSQWIIKERNDIAIAFGSEAERIVKLDERDAIVHAFLPTIEPTGLRVKLHGDISTDPSRMRVVFDERTESSVKDMADLVVDLLGEGLSGDTLSDPPGIVAALIPLSDPRMASLQRHSFKMDLFAAMQRASMGNFDTVRCRPSWINALDFQTLSRTTGIRATPRTLDDIEGLSSLLRFLGAKDASFEELSPALSKTSLSILGASEVVAHLAQLHATKQFNINLMNTEWRLWPVGGDIVSLDKAKAIAKPLDRDFVDLVTEKGVSDTAMRRLLELLSDSATAIVLLPLPNTGAPVQLAGQSIGSELHAPLAGTTLKAPVVSLTRWRGAEQQVCELLATLGWEVKDVSRQNLGYDIEAVTPEGGQVFVEVKSIKNAGEPFIMTSNEEAVARLEGQKYRLAIVRQAEHFLELAFICDPVRRVEMTRQCRQWVWDCTGYEYAPQRFSLE